MHTAALQLVPAGLTLLPAGQEGGELVLQVNSLRGPHTHGQQQVIGGHKHAVPGHKVVALVLQQGGGEGVQQGGQGMGAAGRARDGCGE